MFLTENKFEEFDFINSSVKTDSILTSNCNTNNINTNNNNVKLSELPLLSPASPQDFWGPPSIETVYSDEQVSLISPKSDIKTPFTDSYIESEEEGQTMCLNELINNNSYDTPPLDFETEVIKYSKVAAHQYDKIIECYQTDKPLPIIVEDEFEYYTTVNNESDHVMIDDAVFTKVELSSQDPANMVIYPTTVAVTTTTSTTEVQSSLGDFDNIKIEESSIKEDIDMVKDHQNNQQSNNNNIKETPRVPALKLKIPKIPSNIFDDNVVDTPEIIDQALDLEKDFDLISYITNPEVRHHYPFF